ncbi:hypothetical protein NMY22_g16875 [Coprinellus aureogranulatus]|nr:hypothetical protein NMY22_g16875 [Coprinellus aureogranulatus]
MASSTVNNDRVRGLPLSSSMRALLGAVLRVIDRCLLSLDEARLWGAEEEQNMVPATCDTCCGTGFILVEADDDVSVEDSDVAPAIASGGSMDPVPGYPPSPPLVYTAEMLQFFNINPGNLASSPTSGDASFNTTSVSAPLPPLASQAVTASSLAPAAVAAQSAATSVAVPTSGAIVVPPPNTVIPGFQSLGEYYPIPKPENAVFCMDADGPPFYTITRGKRVGCFGGWDMVSPYVMKAGGVAFLKKPSLVAAYEAYVKAYERGAVQYA